MLTALASRDAGTARAWAAEFDIPRAYGSYEALLADPEIDAVYIPLPNELHRPWTEQAAQAGKHVLCEKPLARDAAEAAAMTDCCRSHSVLLMEAFMWRHQPRMIRLNRRVRHGAIGTLRLIRASFSFAIDPADWRLDPARGGGVLLDVGTYGVNAARLFTGKEPESIRTLVRRGPTGVDLTLATELGFPGGVIAQIDCSFELPYRNRLELVGTAGAIEIPDSFLPGPEPVAHVVRLGTDAGGAAPETWRFAGLDPYAGMVDHFAVCVAASLLLRPAEDGQAQMKVLDAILHEATSV
jgi:predicted dehydrogenase